MEAGVAWFLCLEEDGVGGIKGEKSPRDSNAGRCNRSEEAAGAVWGLIGLAGYVECMLGGGSREGILRAGLLGFPRAVLLWSEMESDMASEGGIEFFSRH